ncbi:MAG TPA: hypothetical protein VH679_11035 [Vicinamibacterales bacterium]|jgi:hypothetical protein
MRWIVTLAVAVWIAGASLAATVFVPTEFREIVADAGLIVRGRVTDIRPIDVPGTGVESIVTVGVETVLKGAANGFVSLRVPGGDTGRFRYVMLGAPVLRPGERAVFFLWRGNDALWRPVGLSMGVYAVHNDPQTGQLVVHPPIVAGRTASIGPVVRGDARRKLLAIQEFESLVQLIMAGRFGQAVPRGGRR